MSIQKQVGKFIKNLKENNGKGTDFEKNLRPLYKDYSKDFKFLVADIETSKWVNFVCVGLFDGEEFAYYEDFGPFFDSIMLWAREAGNGNTNIEWRDFKVDKIYHDDTGKACVRRVMERVLPVPIFVHNGGRYDFNFFMEYIFKCSDPDISFDSGIPVGSSVLCLKVRYRIGEDQYVEICFWDSTKLLPFSLKNLTESFDVEHKKLDIDYKNIEKVTPELLKYLEHDCRGHFEVMTKFYQWDLVKKAGPKFTMASQALQVFRTYLTDTIPKLSNSEDEFVRKGYFGGRTEIFKPYFSSNKKYLKAFDVNSLYPHVMQSIKIWYVPDTFTRKYDKDVFGFWDAEVEVPYMKIPPLPALVKVNKFPKLLFGFGRMRGVWDSNELNYALSLGCKILKVHKGLTFEKGSMLFKDYVNDIYGRRLKAKKEKDDFSNILCKLFLNSLYGRTGISEDKEMIVIDPLGADPNIKIKNEIGDIYLGDIWDEESKEMLPNYTKISAKEQLYAGFSNVAIAAQVTSHSRILMHKYFMKAEEEIYYTDTDSLYTTHEYKSDPDTLGALKFEGQARDACFILPKTYIFEEVKENGKIDKKVRMKGFNYKEDKLDDLDIEEDEEFFKNPKNKKQIEKIRHDALIANIMEDVNEKGKKKFTKAQAEKLAIIEGNKYKSNIADFTIDDFFNYLEGDQKLAALQAPKFGTFKATLNKGQFVMMMDANLKSINSRYDKRIVFKDEKGNYDTRPYEIFIDDKGINHIKVRV